MFDSYLKESIIGRAIKGKKISIKFYNPLDFCEPKRRVDDRPYGGGPGMVLRPELFLKAVEKALIAARKFSSGPFEIGRKADFNPGAPTPGRPFRKLPSGSKLKIIIFSPSGKKFDTAYAKKLVKQKYTDIILISGRYEGIDARVKKIINADLSTGVGARVEEVSIGDYVLTGGELPAMVLIDCVSRQVPGVLGKYESLEEERISSDEVYTRPEVLKWEGKKYRVPKVLLSGNHKLIENWKKSSGRA